jgi:hypothetical protein
MVTDGGVQAGFQQFEQDADDDPDQDDSGCPRDVDGCEGPEMLERGELSCAGCWIHDASREQIMSYREHPDTPDPTAKIVGGDSVAE